MIYRVLLFVESQSGNAYSLSVSFQLADLEEDHEVIFGVTRSCRGASHSAELRGRHWGKRSINRLKCNRVKAE